MKKAPTKKCQRHCTISGGLVFKQKSYGSTFTLSQATIQTHENIRYYRIQKKKFKKTEIISRVILFYAVFNKTSSRPLQISFAVAKNYASA